MMLGIFGWIVVGLLVGFIVSRFLDLHGDDPRLGFAASVAGAVIAATLYTLISGAGVHPFNVWSLLCALAGSGIAVFAWHMIRSRSVSRAPYTRRTSY